MCLLGMRGVGFLRAGAIAGAGLEVQLQGIGRRRVRLGRHDTDRKNQSLTVTGVEEFGRRAKAFFVKDFSEVNALMEAKG